MNKNSASILAIGNEILLGQIVNKNASSLSEKLRNYNMFVDRHIVVEDSKEEIEKGLNFAKEKSNIIFITGGLGPTNDDLTIASLAKILNIEIFFNKEVYQDLVKKLNDRQVRASSNHKKQAFFLSGSDIIPNSIGTANGSYLKKDNFHYFILPGPPNEIASCWQNFIDKKLRKDLSNKLSKKITSFHILGLPESEVADKIEKLLQPYPNLMPEYRMHLPYIEVRFCYEKKEEASIDNLENDIKKNLSPFYFYKNDSPLREFFKKKWHNKSVVFIDHFSNQYLGQRLQDLCLRADYYFCSNSKSSYKLEGYDLVIDLQKKDDLLLKVNDQETIIKNLTSKSLRQGLADKILSELALWKLAND